LTLPTFEIAAFTVRPEHEEDDGGWVDRPA
jgi:hypothetical protein